MRGRGRLLGLALAGLVLASAGCSRRAEPPAATPEEPRPGAPRPEARAGYDGASTWSETRDRTALRGRRIVLDPGHGGRWAGTRGVRGTREADVNLRVALALRDLLAGAGARVHLTRDRDTTVAAPPETTLAEDLRARARVADSLGAEVFLSIHHNADAGGRNDVNETQTYYRTGDEGPSLDLAQILHRHLVRGLRIGVNRLLPGNYAVLRNTRAPAAVLGEPSYLTFPGTEEKLLGPEAVRLEAELYAAALLEYFSRGVPEIVSVAWDTTSAPVAHRALVARVRGEPEAARLFVDGEPVAAEALWIRPLPEAGSWEVRHVPAEPWRDGRRAIALQVRNPAGNHSRQRRDTLAVDLTPTRLALAVHPPAISSGVVELRLEALDAWDRRLADTLRAGEVEWRLGEQTLGAGPNGESGGSADGLLPRRALEAGRGAAGPGVRRSYLRLAGHRDRARIRATWRGLGAEAELAGDPDGSWITGFVVTPEGRGIGGALVRESGGALARANPDGHFALRRRAPGAALALEARAAGHHEPGPQTGADPVLVPIADGALHGRRIALDPMGGGDDPDAEGPSGLRGAAVNLEIARLAREYLERAGARIRLTRESDAPLAPLARVLAAETFGAERVLRIGRRRGAPSAVGHFPGSTRGRALAERLHEKLWRLEERLAGPEASGRRHRRDPVLVEDASYVLQQTSSPAVSFRPGDLAFADVEDRFADPAWRHREAYAIYAALAEDFGASPESLSAVTVRFTAGGSPLPGAQARLDGFLLPGDARGRARFELLSPRAWHRLQVTWPDGSVHEAWIDPARGTSWIWRRGEAAPRPAGDS